jgi:hypothetical protein
MANFLSGFFNNVGQGLTNPKGNLGDFAHAARLYNSNSFRLAPKVKFLYHVVFNVNPAAARSTTFSTKQHGTAINMLVKQVDLPKFKISVDTVQQYNRKKQIQTKIDYDNVNIVFHDDNAGLTTQLWSLYYGYYYADSKTPNAYVRSTYRPTTFRYGLDNNSSVPFFTSITIYQMARHYYQSYTLMNPIIANWQHDTLNNADSDVVQSTMQIAYEAVIYGSGKVSPSAIAGFGQEYYDQQPSPLGILGGGTTSLFGVGGIADGASSILDDLASGKTFGSIGGFLGTLIKGSNVVNNSKKLTTAGIRQEGFNILTSTINASTGAAVAGVANVIFPKNNGNGQNQTTTALGPTSVIKKENDGQRLLNQISNSPAINEAAARMYYSAAGLLSNGQLLRGAEASTAFNNLSAADKQNSISSYNNLLQRNQPAAMTAASKALT